MMRVFYGSQNAQSHRYICRGGVDQTRAKQCIGVGGVRVDKAVVSKIVEAVSAQGVSAAQAAVTRLSKAQDQVRRALAQELEDAQYEASLAARRHEAVDPAKRLVAEELEARWNSALETVANLEHRIQQLDQPQSSQPDIDIATLKALSQDLYSAWNAPGVQTKTKQRITQVLIHEVVVDVVEERNENRVIIHWQGGRHTELRVPRRRVTRATEKERPCPVEVIQKLGGQWPDRQLAVTMNRMRCKTEDGLIWTVNRVREMRERLNVAQFDPDLPREETVTVEEASRRLGICNGSVHRLIRSGTLPATQLMPCAPWQIPVESLKSNEVQTGVRNIIERRPNNFNKLQDNKTLKLPGIE